MPSTASRTREAASSIPIQGLRTTSDGRGLVASYIGGSCDTSAALVVHETGRRIDLVVHTMQSQDVCDFAAHERTVTATLTDPVGSRPIWTSTGKLTPFDGAHLLAPSDLPAGFALLAESSGGQIDTTTRSATTTWSFTYGDADADPAATAGTCSSARGTVRIKQTTTEVQDPAVGLTDVGTRRLGDTTATLWRGDPDVSTIRWSLRWQAAGVAIDVASIPVRVGDNPLTADELVRVALSLKPL